MEKIALSVVAIANQGNYENAYTLILAEKDGNRKLPIVIGMSEAQAIAIQLDGMVPARPLVYDFIFRFASSFDIEILEVIITNVEKGIFYAEIVCKLHNESDEDIVRIDARTSDAVAIALKCRCPIYTYEIVLGKAGYVFGGDGDPSNSSKPNIKMMSTKELNEVLQKAIEKEDYEFASKIRDEIANRESEK